MNHYIRILLLSNVFVQSINFAEYEDPAKLEGHIEKVQESLLKITEEVKESKKKAQVKRKLQYDRKISKIKPEDIYLNDEVLVQQPAPKRTKGGSSKPTFTVEVKGHLKLKL